MLKAKFDSSHKTKPFFFSNTETGKVSDNLTYVQFEKHCNLLRSLGVFVDQSAVRP